jgi:hypothetical protein
MVAQDDLRTRCLQLRHKCVLLRQIHSLMMERFQTRDSILNIGTLLVAAFLTFFGFFGIDKITTIANLIYPLSKDTVDLGYSFIVFLVLLFTILGTAFQFKDKAFRHWRAINLMTDFVTDLDNILSTSSMSEAAAERNMSYINYKYKHITDVLPPSADKDYFRAKKAMVEKEKLKNSIDRRVLGGQK